LRLQKYGSLGGQLTPPFMQNGLQLVTTANERNIAMGETSIAKVIEISAESPSSFEDAIENGIQKASQTVQNIKSAWVKEQEAKIENGKVSQYRVMLKVTFLVN